MIVSNEHMWRRVAHAHALPLSLVFGIAVLVTIAYTEFDLEQLSITTPPLTIVGVTLGILLGFRSNEAYNRYWEARTLWGGLVNHSRTYTRLILTLIPPCYTDGANEAEHAVKAEHAVFHREMIYRQIAFVHALRCHLRRVPVFDDITDLLPPPELAQLKNERNVPAAILHRAGERLRDAWRRGWLQDFHVMSINDTLTELTNVQGGCERIKNTPIPRGYTFLTHKIVIGYCCALPFGLVETLGTITPLVVLLVAFTFLILDRFGRIIEDPFCTDHNSLPLNSLARTIEINLRQRLGESDLPDDLQPTDGVLL